MRLGLDWSWGACVPLLPAFTDVEVSSCPNKAPQGAGAIPPAVGRGEAPAAAASL